MMTKIMNRESKHKAVDDTYSQRIEELLYSKTDEKTVVSNLLKKIQKQEIQIYFRRWCRARRNNQAIGGYCREIDDCGNAVRISGRPNQKISKGKNCNRLNR